MTPSRMFYFSSPLLLAFACLPPYPQAQSGAGGSVYSIAGIVVSAGTGEPVRGVTVAALKEEDSRRVASAFTAADGHFSLDNLPAAKYQLTASKRGYATGAYDEHGDFSSAVATGDDQDTTHIVFRLTPGAVLRGVVTADGGDAVQEAQVMLFKKPDSHRPGEKIAEQDTAVTDDTGTYEFNNLTTGTYLLAAKAMPWYAMHSIGPNSAQSQSTSNPALDVAYPITYFDSTTDEASALPIVLAAGSRVEADFTLHAVPAIRLQLSASSPRPDQGGPRPELRQSIFGETDTEASAGYQTSSNTGGVEFVGVAPGQYELVQGDPPRVSELDVNTSQQVEPGAGLPAAAVSGTLETAGGGRLDGSALVTLEPADAGQGLKPIESSFQRGAFHFPAVAAGTWRLSAEVDGLAETVLSTTIAGKTQAGSTITVQDRPITVEARTTAGGITVEGFARKNGKGIAGVLVLLVPQVTVTANDAVFAEQVRLDQSDSDGSFTLRDVAAGKYIAIAISGGWGLDLTRPELIRRYLPGGFPVTVQESPQKELHLSGPVPTQNP